jgi:hypothetical protein
MNLRTLNLGRRCISKRCNGQAMTEFLIMGAISMIVLFVAIQFAALGREAMALGELNYQVTRWATDPGNNSLKDSSGKAVDSPQCTDVKSLIHGDSVSPYAAVSTVATGYMGKIANAGVACATTPPAGGIAVAMACTVAGGSATTPCTGQRAAGTGVQITLTMDTSSVIFLSTSKTPSFLGVPFPQTLSSTHVMMTQ